MVSGALKRVADHFDEEFDEAMREAPEHPSPWTGASESLDEAVGVPLRVALKQIDEGDLDSAKGHIQSALDILQMYKVSSRFMSLLEKRAAGEFPAHIFPNAMELWEKETESVTKPSIPYPDPNGFLGF
jgi:hypothetical protein